MLLLCAILTFLSTLAGGLFALRFKDKLHLILGFTAGAVIAVSFFDLLPACLSAGSPRYSQTTIAGVIAIGFLLYMILDRMALLHLQARGLTKTARLGAGSLSLHSFFDGIAIGLAFQVSQPAGLFVAVAVIAHDFSDGLNTVGVVLRVKGERKEAFRWLLIDAIAPLIGIACTFFFKVNQSEFAIVLAVLCGFFFYIGASDLLPESHHEHPSLGTTLMTLLGMAVIYFAVLLAPVA